MFLFTSANTAEEEEEGERKTKSVSEDDERKPRIF